MKSDKYIYTKRQIQEMQALWFVGGFALGSIITIICSIIGRTING